MEALVLDAAPASEGRKMGTGSLLDGTAWVIGIGLFVDGVGRAGVSIDLAIRSGGRLSAPGMGRAGLARSGVGTAGVTTALGGTLPTEPLGLGGGVRLLVSVGRACESLGLDSGVTFREGALGLAGSGLFALGVLAGLEADVRDLAGVLPQEPALDPP